MIKTNLEGKREIVQRKCSVLGEMDHRMLWLEERWLLRNSGGDDSFHSNWTPACSAMGLRSG